MKKVYMVKAVKSYEIEIVARDEDDAIQFAEEHGLHEWTGCDFEITDVQLVSSNAKEWFAPDTNEERSGLI